MKNSSKNICLIIDRLGGGGAERVVLNLATVLANLEHCVHIISLCDKVAFDIKDAKFKVHFAKQKQHPLRFIKYFKVSRRAKNVSKIMAKIDINFDLVIANLVQSSELCKTLKLPNLYHCVHSSVSVDIKYQEKGQEIKRFIRKISHPIRIKSRLKDQNLITVSNGIKEGVLNLNIQPKTVQTIYNSFDFADIQNQAEKYKSDEKNYVVHVGRFDKVKRHDILIKAYKKSDIKQKLLLFGDHNNSVGEQIRQLVADLDLTDKVIFKGFNSNPFPFIKNADFLVLSSNNEGLPTVLIEALILGIPVVSTDCLSGPSEILINKLQSFLSPIGDIEALAQNIKKMAESPIKITSDYYQRFSADECVKKYLALCD